MQFKVLNIKDAADRAQWTALWEQWPQKEVHAHPAYVSLYLNEMTEAYCAALESEDGNILYPFICRDITKEPYGNVGVVPLWDIITPYGYGGPFLWNCSNANAVASYFWRVFDLWAAKKNIVSEVIKYNLFNDHMLPYCSAKDEQMKNIVVDLRPDEEVLWMSFDHKVRKNVNKAVRAGVHVAVDTRGERLNDFLKVYKETLDRRAADRKYYFNAEYFTKMHEGLPGQFAYFHALHDNQVISTELVLISAESIYSFLGGTLKEKFSLSPNDLLKYEIIKWAKNNSKKYFVLGGGYENEDGIYRHKRSFSPAGIFPFYIGSRICNAVLYNKLLNNKKEMELSKGNSWAPVTGFIPEYRT